MTEHVQDETSDAELIRRILDGHVNDFAHLMGRYQAYVAAITTRHVPRERVEEVAHETFIRVYRSLESFRAETPFKHWLARIAVRCCCDFWRAHYRNRETPISSISDNGWEWIQGLLVEGSVGSPADQERNQQALQVLRWAMEALSPEDRTVLTLVHLEDYTTAEAAKLLRWSVPKVKIRAHRARKKLRKALEGVMPGR
jgi:RNA polymerase sigma-70 factor (ECF subfamily)